MAHSSSDAAELTAPALRWVQSGQQQRLLCACICMAELARIAMHRDRAGHAPRGARIFMYVRYVRSARNSGNLKGALNALETAGVGPVGPGRKGSAFVWAGVGLLGPFRSRKVSLCTAGAWRAPCPPSLAFAFLSTTQGTHHHSRGAQSTSETKGKYVVRMWDNPQVR